MDYSEDQSGEAIFCSVAGIAALENTLELLG
jgi:hypothetical protein